MAKRSDADVLMQRIADEFEALPRQLQGVARYLEEHRTSIMVQRVTEIAEGCGVHASAVVRFAQRFGYSGFTEMQAVFRDAYTEQAAPARSYQQRIRSVIKGRPDKLPAVEIASRFIEASKAGLDELAAELDESRFQAAVDMLANAENIYVVGVRRSFAIASYIAYALQHTTKRVHLVSGLGGMYREQLRSIGKGDAMIAISFPPYGKETLYAMRVAQQHKAHVLAITESDLGPLGRHASVVLKVKEGSAFAFRGLTSTMCLCQALFVALAYKLELTVEETLPRGEYDD
ncbi:DNA-binding MurR/RpiR family transcriptional regulator [Luteibacter sp. Sphag1AF]|uniref:MurR/RpiR family transcriptional regulator n=1 Tax=Luteibacter sp. Sphag1AF TaxID=2587031 RepID=UPI001607E1E5|nr:MurR/RpiR family transcriptional regulator [Luteibacter sp. Sphag1AF]MBB3225984.1 DNA-binding MurR/RpiR family transcriptional regulator [Luteibacter sp. Sphag1AF]